ncbi:Uncharacterised protein [Mycobacterium tuberculosis]|nr:Uncharacterised protein [Mycobacterium tuberculosis]
MAYQPVSMQKITAGTASASTSGTSRGRKAAKMLA